MFNYVSQLIHNHTLLCSDTLYLGVAVIVMTRYPRSSAFFQCSFPPNKIETVASPDTC